MSEQASSSDKISSSELKAGHAPATKVGGMRVGAPRPRHSSHGEDKNTATGNRADETEDVQQSSGEATENQADDNNEEVEGIVANRAAGELVSGVFVPVEKAYPTEAVKHIHDKPGTHPKNEYHAHPKVNEQRFINQPRKQ